MFASARTSMRVGLAQSVGRLLVRDDDGGDERAARLAPERPRLERVDGVQDDVRVLRVVAVDEAVRLEDRADLFEEGFELGAGIADECVGVLHLVTRVRGSAERNLVCREWGVTGLGEELERIAAAAERARARSRP